MHSSTQTSSISVLIPDGDTWDAVKVLRCLNRVSGIKTYVLARTKLPLARLSRYCSGCYCRVSESTEDWLDIIRNMVQDLRIDVLLPVTQIGVEFVARNRQAISEFAAIPSLVDYELLMMAQNKWAFYCFAVQNGFPVPESVLIEEAGEASVDSLDLDFVKYPALLKPTLLDGGYGIVKVKKPSDLAHALKDKCIKKGYQYILQSYVPGVDLCLQVFCKGGEIIKYTIQKSLLLSDNHFGPQRIMEFVEDNGVLELGSRLVSTMEFEGVACIDFRIDMLGKTRRILEINPRFGQAILGSLVAGINFPLLACFDALGSEYPRMQYKTVKYAHPMPYLKIIMSRIIRRSAFTNILWRQSGLQFTCSDPMPALFDAFCKTTRRLKRPIRRMRSPS